MIILVCKKSTKSTVLSDLDCLLVSVPMLQIDPIPHPHLLPKHNQSVNIHMFSDITGDYVYSTIYMRIEPDGRPVSVSALIQLNETRPIIQNLGRSRYRAPLVCRNASVRATASRVGPALLRLLLNVVAVVRNAK
jgi:hypothetical protein